MARLGRGTLIAARIIQPRAVVSVADASVPENFTVNSAARVASPTDPAMQSLVVPYFYPSAGGSDWDTLEANPPDIAIANPGTPGGPGSTVNSDWTAELNQAVAAGIKVIGYVDLNYAARSLGTASDDGSSDTVYGDINAWHDLYPQVTGWFFDRVQSGIGGAGDLPHAQSAVAYARSKISGSLVVFNHGTWPIDQAFADLGDILCVFEGTWTSYQASWSPPSWASAYPAAAFYHIAYSVPTANLQDAVDLAYSRNAGWVYVTDQAGFTSLASNWSAERAAIRAVPGPGPSPGVYTAAAITAARRGRTGCSIVVRSVVVSASNVADVTIGETFGSTVDAVRGAVADVTIGETFDMSVAAVVIPPLAPRPAVFTSAATVAARTGRSGRQVILRTPPTSAPNVADVTIGETFGFAVDATVDHSSDVTITETFGLDAGATRGAVGSVTVPLTFGITADASTGATIAIGETFGATVAATRGAVGSVTVPLTFGIIADAAWAGNAGVSISLAVDIASSATRDTPSASTAPLTFGTTVSAIVTSGAILAGHMTAAPASRGPAITAGS